MRGFQFFHSIRGAGTRASSRRSGVGLTGLALLLVFAGLLGLDASAAHAAGPRFAGDSQSFWMVRPAAPGPKPRSGPAIELFHRADGPGSTMIRLGTLTGRILPQALAHHENRLWLGYHSNPVAVQSLRRVDTEMGPSYEQTHRPAVPKGLMPLAAAGAHDGLWLLARPTHGAELKPQPDSQSDSPADPQHASQADGEPRQTPPGPDAPSSDATRSENKRKTDAADTRSASAARHVLLRLRRFEWRRVKLPDGWGGAQPVWLVAPGEGDDPPTLIQRVEGRIHVHQLPRAFTSEPFEPPPAEAARAATRSSGGAPPNASSAGASNAGASNAKPTSSGDPGQKRSAANGSGSSSSGGSSDGGPSGGGSSQAAGSGEEKTRPSSGGSGGSGGSDDSDGSGGSGEPWRWSSRVYDLSVPAKTQWVQVEGQLVAAAPQAGGRFELMILRDGRTIEVGRLELSASGAGASAEDGGGGAASDASPAAGRSGPAGDVEAWRSPTVFRLHQSVGLAALGADDRVYSAAMDLQGRSTPAWPPLQLTESPPWSPTADVVVLLGVLTLSTVLLVVSRGRQEESLSPKLPSGMAPADLSVRFLAAMIDLGPWAAIGVVAFNLTPLELVNHWPGHSGGWRAMIPGAAVLAAFVLYSFIAELIARRTLGKALFGLVVVDLDGAPPGLGALAARNLLKAADLIAPPLLLLPFLSPARQRLGDLVVRTTVVRADTSDPDEEDPDEESPNKQDRDDQHKNDKNDRSSDPAARNAADPSDHGKHEQTRASDCLRRRVSLLNPLAPPRPPP